MLRADANWRIRVTLGMALLSAVWTLQAQPEAPIAPARVFDLSVIWSGGAAPAGKVHKVLARGSLYFLVSPSFSTVASSIVRTNDAGRVQQVTALPADAIIQDFEADSYGTVYVLLLRKGNPEQQLLIYGPDGNLAQNLHVPDNVTGLCAAGNRILALGAMQTGLTITTIGPNPTQLASVPLRRPTSVPRAFALADGRVAIVEQTAAAVHLVDLERGSEVAIMPRVPEMQWLATLPPGNHTRNVAFRDGTSAPDGRIFLILGNSKLSEGAPIIAFHMNGNLFQTIRYNLPKFRGQADPMVPSFIAVYNGAILVLVGGDGKVAEYPL